jgi:hypothetical protein
VTPDVRKNVDHVVHPNIGDFSENEINEFDKKIK